MYRVQTTTVAWHSQSKIGPKQGFRTTLWAVAHLPINALNCRTAIPTNIPATNEFTFCYFMPACEHSALARIKVVAAHPEAFCRCRGAR